MQNNKRGMGAMGKLSSHKHTPKNDDDASDKCGPPSQIALGMCAGFSFRGEKFPPRDKFFMNSFGAGDKKKLVWKTRMVYCQIYIKQL